MTEFVLLPVSSADTGEILTLQRAAFVSEAQLYGDLELPPLVETHEQLIAELSTCLALKAVADSRMLGAGRARIDGAVLHIGRLVVAPDMQGRGVGTRLLQGLERLAPPTVKRFSLFTGHKSESNIRLYERQGYTEARRGPGRPGVELVYLEKDR